MTTIEWHADDELPDKSDAEYLIACTGSAYIHIGQYNPKGAVGWYMDGMPVNVYAWAPLPKAPNP